MFNFTGPSTIKSYWYKGNSDNSALLGSKPVRDFANIDKHFPEQCVWERERIYIYINTHTHTHTQGQR